MTEKALSPELVEKVAKAIHDDTYSTLPDADLAESWAEFKDETDLANLANPFISNATAALTAALPILREQVLRDLGDGSEERKGMKVTENFRLAFKTYLNCYAREHDLDLDGER